LDKPVVFVRNAPTITIADTTGKYLNEMIGGLQQKLRANYVPIGLSLPEKGENVMRAFL